MNELRLAMLGLVDGNGHPWSWSALYNGWDEAAMRACPFAAIPAYLGENRDRAPIEGARVTHIWTDDPTQAPLIARAALIPEVLQRPQECLGKVDAVLIATDKGGEHIERARPFVEAGLPVFVDKPLCDNASDLKIWCDWVAQGRPILSNSAMRYAREFAPFHRGGVRRAELGALRLGAITTPKSWERYGIHALESIFPIFGPGFVSARNTGAAGRDIVHFRHREDADVVVAAIEDALGSFGALQLCGTQGFAHAKMDDSYFAFRAQLEAFADFVRTGERPFPWSETVELMQMVIAGIWSREQGGREVLLNEVGEN